MEQWKTISGYPAYEISNTGRIRRCVSTSNRSQVGFEPQQVVDKKGYLRVALFQNGKRRYLSVHRLVASAFLPNPEGLPTVNHKDGNKTHNDVSNLEWANFERQIAHAIDHGLIKADGCYWRESENKWIAQIETGGRKARQCVRLGAFETKEQAHAAYIVARKER